jgi:hypothetical protein
MTADGTGGMSGTGGNGGGATGTPAGSGGTMSVTAAGGATGAGGAADGGAGGMGADCDGASSPSAEPCLVADEFAVFVSPDGDDDDDGTMTDPVATFARAVELATEDEKIVVACSGDYDEEVVIDAGVRVYGSFDCDDDWAYAPDEPSVVAPGTSGFALQVRDASGEVVIEDVQFVARDAVAPGESSVAGFVSESARVTLRRVVLEARSGAAGDDGMNPGFASQFPEVTELQGIDGDVTSGGEKLACECPGGATSTAGSGGGLGEDGDIGLPDHTDPGGEGGNALAQCSGGGGLASGQPGAPGPSPDDASGAALLGMLDAGGFVPSGGANGEHGAPGQGGGGGAGKTAGGGGSGGCGGCGGRGGPGGQGGGASIALLVFESTVTIEASELVANDGADGGDGAAGEMGQQQFGGGGDGFGVGDGGCDGGNGGIGGNGASGGGGAGGISAGVVWAGDAEPVIDEETSIEVGDPGGGGEGGTPGDNDGIDGEAEDVIELE